MMDRSSIEPGLLEVFPSYAGTRIVILFAQGFTNVELAGRLFLTQGTVRNYVSAILTMLDVGDRIQAAILAVKHS